MTRMLMTCAGVVCLLLAGCASAPKTFSGLSVSDRLEPVPKGTGAFTYVDKSHDFSPYRRLLVEQVVVYTAADHGFGDIPDAERTRMATFIDAQARLILARTQYPIATEPGPDVLRLRLTLVGMTPSRAMLQGMTYVIPVGAALNLVKGASGGSGTFMGSVTLAGEFYDAMAGNLLAGFVATRSPNALNVTALSSSYEAAGQGAVSLLEDLRRRIDKPENVRR